ncbi:MAG: Ku protein [Pedosphaera sp.]|nr:Ku protein [Pedosphaera sp.]
MHAIWKGTLSFGLVSIPVALHPAVQRDELKFRMLRKSDLSPISYKRVAEVDAKEVSNDEIVKGYEYEPDHFVVLNEEDFNRPKADGVQTIQLMDFVGSREIDPMYFDKPYYLVPEKGGAKPFALLRDALIESGTLGIAKVVIRTKQHLAALKPKDNLLLLELMHFEEELVDPQMLQSPRDVQVGKTEKEMAKALIGAMTTKWNPAKYSNDYKSALMEVIERKIKEGEKGGKRRSQTTKLPGNVVDIFDVLQRSLLETTRSARSKPKVKKRRSAA